MATKIVFCAVAVFPSLISSVVRGSPIEISAGEPGTLRPNNPFANLLTFNDLPDGLLAYYQFAGGSLTGNGAIEASTIPGISAQPAGDSTKYLTVSYPSGTGHVFFKFSGQENYFGLYWGSIDGYNSVAFLKNSELIATYSGVNIASLTGLLANGQQQSATSNRYIEFRFDAGFYDEVILSTTDYGFEVDDIAFGDPPAPIPEPHPLMLLGSLFCFISLIQIRRKRPKVLQARKPPQ